MQVISSAAPTAPYIPATLGLQKLDVITLLMTVFSSYIVVSISECGHRISLTGKSAPITKYSNGSVFL